MFKYWQIWQFWYSKISLIIYLRFPVKTSAVHNLTSLWCLMHLQTRKKNDRPKDTMLPPPMSIWWSQTRGTLAFSAQKVGGFEYDVSPDSSFAIRLSDSQLHFLWHTRLQLLYCLSFQFMSWHIMYHYCKKSFESPTIWQACCANV